MRDASLIAPPRSSSSMPLVYPHDTTVNDAEAFRHGFRTGTCRDTVRRMRRLLTLALALAALAPTAASAAEVPGTARFALTERGTVAVAPGSSVAGSAYAPVTGRRTFTLFARLRAPVVRRPTTVLVRHKAASARCAASHAADRGVRLAVGVGVPDAAGYLTLTSREVNWRRTGARRFCVWLTTKPRARVKPASSVVRFYERGTGGVQLATRNEDGVGVLTYVASTDPYSLARSSFNCPPDSATDYGPRTRAGSSGLIEYFSFEYSPADCTRGVTVSVSGSTAGAFALSMDVAQAAAGAINHAGGMCTLPNVSEPLLAARALVVAQGCRVGREIPARKDGVGAGRVWVYAVNGARASLVPRGTRVDLGVQPG
jgi:hypothetical protein